MVQRRFQIVCFVALSLVFRPSFADADGERSAAQKPSAETGLVVVIAVDQLRRDRLDERLPGGLGALIREGRWFTQATLGHGVSTTCPGHAVMLTGLHPNRHGLPSNTFFDRAEGTVRYCLDDQDPAARVIGGREGRSPRNMTANTLGDWLKAAKPNSKTFSVAAKDRAAIALGGQGPDGVFWFSRDHGRFTSSGYYMNTLPVYVSAFNGKEPTEDGFMANLPASWQHGEGQRRPDDYEGEDPKFSRVSGHPVNTGNAEAIGGAVFQSPFMDSITIDLALEVVREERLGQRDTLDLLTIGLSATDTVGHLYGPRSAEAEDALIRLDQDLGRLMTSLAKIVGDEQLWIVLTADHGVAELPEWRAAQGASQCPVPEGRIGYLDLGRTLYWAVYTSFSWPFGDPRDWISLEGGHLVVNRDKARAEGVDPQEVIRVLEEALESEAYVAAAWREDELAEAASGAGLLMARSYVPGRTGDLLVQLHEDCLIDDLGTTHGSLYGYDRDVPLIFFGPNIGVAKDPAVVETVDIGPTLADWFDVPMPTGLDGKIRSLSELPALD